MKFNDYNFSSEDLQKRIVTILKGTEKYSKKELQFLLSIIDLTTLEATDNSIRIKEVCQKAYSFSSLQEGMPNVAAVCFYPPFMKEAKVHLAGKGIALASVAGAFPSGQSPLFVKLEEIKYAIREGADEIDMVISRGSFLAGDFEIVQKEIETIKEVCDKVHLKVILETGELSSVANIRKASILALNGGGDFLKTSTGKVQPAATLEAFIIMLDSIKEYYETTGKKIGIKAAGGISTPEVALQYYALVDSILGDEWLTKDLFRIGASRLASNLVDAIV